jgi:hypothetical protein
LLARLSSHVRRIAESVGLDKVRRDTTPTIDQLVASHKAAAKAAERAKPLAATPVAPTSSSPTGDHSQLVAAPVPRSAPVEEAI